MKTKNKKVDRRLKIRRKIRKIIQGTAAVPRLSIFKSNKCIYAQLIDDEQGHTLLATSSKALGDSGIDVDKARKVGKAIAEKALERGIEAVVFDRSGYLYHGRVKALAEGARDQGLKF
ncbi:MAG: 50S ribosomal protein L18 [Amoebophilaceae bacterium]|jgi:large subunit ribosomal protein L18|nr:50S ribosomal protein L18 [Amoebophilaceae bacterium]